MMKIIKAYDEKITPEQEALLRGHNFREYPAIQELSAAKLLENVEKPHDKGKNFWTRVGKAARTGKLHPFNSCPQ